MVCWTRLGASVVPVRIGKEVLCIVKCQEEELALKDHSRSHLQTNYSGIFICCLQHKAVVDDSDQCLTVTPGRIKRRISGEPRSLSPRAY